MRRGRLTPFRLGLWLGVLAGLIWFVQRYRTSRDEVVAAGASGWGAVEPRLPEPPPVTPRVVPPVEPAEPIVEPEVVVLPEPEPEPVEPVEPVAKKVPPVKKAAKRKAAIKKKAAGRQPAAWVAPDPDGICPASHPVKAKTSSGLFHLPGMFAYARTKPDRCYRDESAAEADGLQRAKR